MTEHEKIIIMAYARNDMSIRKTADVLRFGYTTINYHLEKIWEKYGLNPKRFFDLVQLVEMAKDEKIR